jgi:hypothetical protein
MAIRARANGWRIVLQYGALRVTVAGMNRSACFCLWLAVASLLAVPVVDSAESARSKIEAREPRAQIRAEILKQTKQGSSADEVLKFIVSHFQPKQDAPAPKLENHAAVGPTAEHSGKRGVKSIRLVLGRYYANPGLFFMDIPFIAQTTTVVQWAFNKEGELIEVFVDKDAELGASHGAAE